MMHWLQDKLKGEKKRLITHILTLSTGSGSMDSFPSFYTQVVGIEAKVEKYKKTISLLHYNPSEATWGRTTWLLYTRVR
jgi:hypothetical protein